MLKSQSRLSFLVFLALAALSFGAGTATAANEAQCAEEWADLNKASKSALQAFLRPCGKSANAAKAKRLLAQKYPPPPPPPPINICDKKWKAAESSDEPSDYLQFVLDCKSHRNSQIAKRRAIDRSGVGLYGGRIYNQPVIIFGGQKPYSAQTFSIDKQKRLADMGFKPNPLYAINSTFELLGGMDVVGTVEGKSFVQGYRNYMVAWNGAIWAFDNEINMNRFLSNPSKYNLPYGGLCAECLAQGHVSFPDNKQFIIFEGYLYLFSSQGFKEQFIDKSGVPKASRLSAAASKWNTLHFKEFRAKQRQLE